jgi:CRISPR-associated protein Cas2
MIIISYDFTDNKTRSAFSKFLKKFGYKEQYSVYKIKNSKRVLNNILKEIDLIYKKRIKKSDSVIIFPLCAICKKKMIRYGFAKNSESDIIVFK